MSAHRHAGPSGAPQPTGWSRFAARYGWRAYALPILAVITGAALLQQAGADGSPNRAPTSHHPVVAQPAAPGEAARFADEGGPDQDTDAAPVAVTLRRGTESDACADNSYAQLALVSLSQQRVWMCEKHRQVYSTPVTTGATTDNDETPVGSWRVQSRERDRYLVGAGYRDYVHYWVPFNGDFGFHDATWQTMPFGSPGYTTQGSHGCVHMPMTAMKWFYDWSQVDDTVVTVEA